MPRNDPGGAVPSTDNPREDDWLMNPTEVAEVMKISKRTLRTMVAEGEFLQPISLGTKTPRWRHSDVQRWIKDLTRTRTQRKRRWRKAPDQNDVPDRV